MLLIYLDKNGNQNFVKFNGYKKFLNATKVNTVYTDLALSNDIICITKDFTIQKGLSLPEVRDFVEDFCRSNRTYDDHEVSNFKSIGWWSDRIKIQLNERKDELNIVDDVMLEEITLSVLCNFDDMYDLLSDNITEVYANKVISKALKELFTNEEIA